MDQYAHPPIVVEAALRAAAIDWTPGANGRQGAFDATCPLCRKPLVMQWIGHEFVFKCSGGHAHAAVVKKLGIDPAEMPRAPLSTSTKTGPVRPSNPKPTEHTEHSGQNPHGERDRVFGLGGEHSTEHAPNTLAQTSEFLIVTTS